MKRKIISYEIKKLGEYLKQLREEQDLSIRRVAKHCDIAPSYLAKIEAGDTYKTIGVETLVKVSKFYGIPASAMLKEAGFINSHDDRPARARSISPRQIPTLPSSHPRHRNGKRNC